MGNVPGVLGRFVTIRVAERAEVDQQLQQGFDCSATLLRGADIIEDLQSRGIAMHEPSAHMPYLSEAITQIIREKNLAVGLVHYNTGWELCIRNVPGIGEQTGPKADHTAVAASV